MATRTARGIDEKPVILGGGAVPFRRYSDGSHWRDWVSDAIEGALAEANLERRDIDSVVVASESDFFSLQLNPAPVILDDAGLTGCPAVRVEAGGASGGAALRTAFTQLTAGLADCVLVVGFEAGAGHLPADTTQLLYGLSFDAEIEGMAGATAVSLYALSISLHMAVHGTTVEQMASVSVKNHGNALANPLAHKPMRITVEDVLASPEISAPYRRLDCSPVSDGAAAVVMARPGWAPAPTGPRCWITGSGAGTDHPRLGDRPEPHAFAAKQQAARAAYEMAGVAKPRSQIQVAEVYDAFTGAEIQAIEALGLAQAGEAGPAVAAGEFSADGPTPVNLSGGLIGQGGAPGAVGVMQAVTVARLLAADDGPDRGLIDVHGGICTTNFVHVLERVEP
jgi:acetyl-CoA C-acetyltransferase